MTGIREWSEVAVVALATMAVLLLAWLVGRKASQSPRRKLPPGPRGWPILGSLFSLGTRPHQSLYELSRQYGPLMFMRLGSVKTLVITSPKFAEEVLKTHDKIMASRPVLIVARHVFSDDMAWSPYGHHWRHLRKVCTVGLLTARRISQFRDMIAAGGDTSSMTALWALTELLKKPRVLRKVQAELDSVVGPDRLVQEEDLSRLQYLDAVVKETLRLHPPGPLLAPHETTQECEIEGFHIPARTRIFVNVYGIHRDPAVHERPLEFDPDRFVNSTIDFKGQDFEFLPFGSGRRMCPGLNLGALMVMYPLAVLLHALDWALPEGQKLEELDMSETFGLVLYKRIPLSVFGKPRLRHHVLYPNEQVSKQ